MQPFLLKKYGKHNEKLADTMHRKYDQNVNQPTSKNENVCACMQSSRIEKGSSKNFVLQVCMGTPGNAVSCVGVRFW